MDNLDEEFTLPDGGLALIDATVNATDDPIVITFRLLDSATQIQVQVPRMLSALDTGLLNLMVQRLPELLDRVFDPEDPDNPFGIVALPDRSEMP